MLADILRCSQCGLLFDQHACSIWNPNSTSLKCSQILNRKNACKHVKVLFTLKTLDSLHSNSTKPLFFQLNKIFLLLTPDSLSLFDSTKHFFEKQEFFAPLSKSNGKWQSYMDVGQALWKMMKPQRQENEAVLNDVTRHKASEDVTLTLPYANVSIQDFF